MSRNEFYVFLWRFQCGVFEIPTKGELVYHHTNTFQKIYFPEKLVITFRKSKPLNQMSSVIFIDVGDWVKEKPNCPSYSTPSQAIHYPCNA